MPTMAARRLSWMDQVASSPQRGGSHDERRQSDISPTTQTWAAASRISHLRATAQSWIPSHTQSSTLEEAIEDDESPDHELSTDLSSFHISSEQPNIFSSTKVQSQPPNDYFNLRSKSESVATNSAESSYVKYNFHEPPKPRFREYDFRVGEVMDQNTEQTRYSPVASPTLILPRGGQYGGHASPVNLQTLHQTLQTGEQQHDRDNRSVPFRSWHSPASSNARVQNSDSNELVPLQSDSRSASLSAVNGHRGMASLQRSGSSGVAQSRQEIHMSHPEVSFYLQSSETEQNRDSSIKRTTQLADFRLAHYPGPLSNEKSQYAVVEFKLFRAEIYQVAGDWSVEEGMSLVIVEADRGIDLGKVFFVGSDPEDARHWKRHLNRKHWSALLRNSSTSHPSEADSEVAFRQVYEWTTNSPYSSTGFSPTDGTSPPRSIIRRAERHEVMRLQYKEGIEERARRLCCQKAKEHNFFMEILAAEFQFDNQKLTFYYLSPAYVAFNPLINELYKIFKTRIWFVPLNPASFVPPPGGRGNSFSARS